MIDAQLINIIYSQNEKEVAKTIACDW